MLYPLIFKPDMKERVWGGTKLKELYNKELPSDHIGESWEIASHKNGRSIIENGCLKGQTIDNLMITNKDELLGKQFSNIKKFPLLVKLLDANDKLSIQVHPQDDYAMKYEDGELGKTEMWYIIDAKPGAKLVVGVKPGITKEQFRNGIESGNLEELIIELPVKNGDVINIPSGMLHAIEDGIVIAEIQQNSDTTYRVYDWNRVGLDGKPRELHIDKAMNVIDFEGKIATKPVIGLSIKSKEYIKTYYIANKYFAFEKIDLMGEMIEKTNNIKFYLYTCVEGRGIIVDKGKEYSFNAGQSFMIPAAVENYKLQGTATLLKSYIPNIDEDIILPLKEYGYNEEEIYRNVNITRF